MSDKYSAISELSQKDKIFRFLLNLLIFILICFLVWLLTISAIKANKGEYVNLWGWELNSKRPCADTFYIHDTIRVKELVLNPNSNTPNKRTGGETAPKNQINNAKNQVVGNNFGSVGDNYISNERVLTESDKAKTLSALEEARIKYNIDTKVVLVNLTPDSNGGKFAYQLKEFLKKEGYTIPNYQGISYRDQPLQNIEIGPDRYEYLDPDTEKKVSMKCISLTIGIMN